MFYEKFLDLCISRNISPSAAAQEAGFSNAASTDWKNGAKPRKANLKKLANYFNVPVEYFDDEPIAGIKKDPAETGEVNVTDKEIKFALFGGDEDVPEEAYEDVKRYAEFVKEKYKAKF